MPMQLLLALADAELPLDVADPQAVEKLRILQAAGHVLCEVQGPHGVDSPCAVRVYEVTALGYKALRYFGPASWHRRCLAPGNLVRNAGDRSNTSQYEASGS